MKWLISLLVSPQEAEAITGDLQEERSQISARDGEPQARRWFARQTIRTVWHLTMSPFREAPGMMFAIGLLGFALTFPASWVASRLAAAVVVRVSVYDYIAAKLFWQLVAAMAPLLVGFVGAWLLGKRAVPGALSMFLVAATVVSVIDPIVFAVILPPKPHYSAGFFVTRALALLVPWALTTMLGTAIGIKLRQRILTN